MWQTLQKRHFRAGQKKFLAILAALSVLGLLLAGCGGSSSAPTAVPAAVSNGSSVQSAAPVRQPDKSSGTMQQYGPQYLIKSLQVTMEVPNSTQAASDLQQWVAFNDPQSTSNGSDYESMGNGQYTVTLSFLVDVAHYTQVQAYLRDYANQKGHVLDSLKETVQDVTNDYIDSESTLTNLRTEQQRLLALMNQAQNVSDAANIAQQLAQVEGQINQIEGHLNALKGQTTFYNVTVVLQPIGSAPPPPSPWSVIPVWQGAWAAVIVVWQGLVSFLVWLLAFSVYLVPIGIAIWLIRKRPWRTRTLPASVQPASVKPGVAKAVPAESEPAEPVAAGPE